MLTQRDRTISLEPTRIIQYTRRQKWQGGKDLTRQQLEKILEFGIENLELEGDDLLAVLGDRVKRDTTDTRNKNLIRSNRYNGWLSEATARQLRMYVQTWNQAIELASDKAAVDEERVFLLLLTLTLHVPQMHTDYEVKKFCLEWFLAQLNREEDTRYQAEVRHIESTVRYKPQRVEALAEARKRHELALRKVFWRAEVQREGAIHFHLLLDQWTDKDRVRNLWNEALERIGYLTDYRQLQRHRYRVTSRNRLYPEGVEFYGDYVFRVDREQATKKVRALRERISRAIQTRKQPFMAEEGEVLYPLFRQAIASGKRPSEKALQTAAVELQRRAFRRAVDADFSDPPTTRIESLRDKASIAAYISKYLTKPSMKLVHNGGVSSEKIFELAAQPGYHWAADENTLLDPDGKPVLEEKTEVKLEGRRIHGRLWGKSRALNTLRDFGFFKVTHDSLTFFQGAAKNGEKEVVRRKNVVRRNLFGESFAQEEATTQTVPNWEYHTASVGQRLFDAGRSYLQSVAGFVGEANIWHHGPPDRELDPETAWISILKLRIPAGRKEAPPGMVAAAGHAKAAEQKRAPTIAVPQTALLRKLAPDLEPMYLAHYTDLFFALYWDTRHVPPGAPRPYATTTHYRAHTQPDFERRVEIRLAA